MNLPVNARVLMTMPMGKILARVEDVRAPQDFPGVLSPEAMGVLEQLMAEMQIIQLAMVSTYVNSGNQFMFGIVQNAAGQWFDFLARPVSIEIVGYFGCPIPPN